MSRVTTFEVATPSGPARVQLERPAGEQHGILVLTHGAGGRFSGSEFTPIRTTMVELGWAVALVEQAWVVAGQKAPPKAPTQDPAWLPVVAAITSGRRRLTGPLVVGGKSNGARVACRTAHTSGADGVLALSFPLHPPGKPQVSRAGELRTPLQHGIPLHVVQGATDPFGGPAEVRAELPDPGLVTEVPGAHSFPRPPRGVVEAVQAFLQRVG